MEAQRLVQLDALVQLEAHSIQPLFAAGVAAVQNRHVVGLGQMVDGGEQVDKILLCIDVFLAVGGEQHVLLRLQAQALQHIAGLDLGKVSVQHFGHRGTGDKGTLLGGALGVQVTAGMLGIAHVHVRNMVHNAAVGLLGQALVKAAVAGLHMEDGNMQALGRNGRQAAVGVAQDQQGVRLLLHHQSVGFCNNVADGLAQVLSDGVQVEVRRAQAQVLKKDLVQVIIVVLAGVDQDLIKVDIALFDNGRQPDNFRSGTDDGHEF